MYIDYVWCGYNFVTLVIPLKDVCLCSDCLCSDRCLHKPIGNKYELLLEPHCKYKYTHQRATEQYIHTQTESSSRERVRCRAIIAIEGVLAAAEGRWNSVRTEHIVRCRGKLTHRIYIFQE